VTTPDLVSRFRSARADPSLAVLEGFHAIKHAIRFHAEFEAVATWDMAAARDFAERLAPDVGAPLAGMAVEVSRELFDQLSPTPPDTGVIAIAVRRVSSLVDVVAGSGAAPIVLLESPSHSGNIGAVIRVAAGAGAAAVVTTGTNDPWNPGAIRGSAGLHYALPVIRTDTLEFDGRGVIAIDPAGDELTGGAIPPGAILAFGSERSGLSPELLAMATQRLRIPMQWGVSSLNLATAVAIALYSWRLAE
jgi:TrmH family RNA methyltransferase